MPVGGGKVRVPRGAFFGRNQLGLRACFQPSQADLQQLHVALYRQLASTQCTCRLTRQLLTSGTVRGVVVRGRVQQIRDEGRSVHASAARRRVGTRG